MSAHRPLTSVMSPTATSATNTGLPLAYDRSKYLQLRGDAMKSEPPSVRDISVKVEALRELAKDLYENSADFPAVNRNAKRILASVEMLRINLCRDED